MNEHTITLSHNQVYFLTKLIGNISSSKYKDIINDMDTYTDVKCKMSALVNKDFGKILDDIYKELIKCKVCDVMPLITKYKVLYKYGANDDKYGVSLYRYKTAKEFQGDNPSTIAIDIIVDSAKEFTE